MNNKSMKNHKKLPPIHPGEILREEFLIPLKLSQAELARSINVSTKRVNDICQEKRSITPDTAYRLGIYFNMGPNGMDFWLNLQQKYERECWKDTFEGQEKQIRKEVHPLPANILN